MMQFQEKCNKNVARTTFRAKAADLSEVVKKFNQNSMM